MRGTHVVAILIGLLGAAPLACQNNDHPRTRAKRTEAGPVERVYLGVSCDEPNAVRCDRVGLYVWLRRPARRVTAQVGGRRLRLGKRVAPSLRPGTEWQGFLKNAGLDNGPLAVEGNARGKWFGEPPVRARIRLTLDLNEMPSVTRSLCTPLRAGYG